MEEWFAGEVYDTLRGDRQTGIGAAGVENLFAPGMECEKLYERMLAAYGRLCVRLGREDEDPDVEIIISALMGIERRISFRMYEYGAKFGIKKQ